MYNAKVALITGKTSFALTTNSEGNLGMYIALRAIKKGGNSQTTMNTGNAMVMTYGQGFSVETGSNGGTLPTYYASPIYTKAGDMVKFRISSVSVELLPNTSLDKSQGNLTMAYLQNAANETFSTNTPALPMGDLLNAPYVQYGNVRQTYRTIKVPDDVTEEELVTDYSNAAGLYGGDIVYIVLQGCTPSTTVYRAVLNLNYEVVVTSAQQWFSPMRNTPVADGTRTLINSLMAKRPDVFCMAREEAAALADKIAGLPQCRYHAVYQTLLTHPITNGMIREDQSWNLANGEDTSMLSFAENEEEGY